MFLMAALATTASIASAQGPRTNQNNTTSNMTLSATAQTALQLDIATATSGATVNGTAASGVFDLSFGNVNGLGIANATPTSGVTVAVPDNTGALYTTPIKLTPRFSGFTSTTATISVKLDGAAGNALGNANVREGASATTTVLPTTTATTVTTTATTNTSFDRYVGFFVPATNGAGTSGAMSSKLIYTITVP